MNGPLQLGRYSVCTELASGGMATVYLGRLNGPVGFGRTVAIKRLHPHLARDPNFSAMFMDEARLAARIQHPNVVPTIDVVANENELFLVLEYVRGETLAGLLRAAINADSTVPVPVAVAIVIGVLSGLHAAHEATDEQGHPLQIVHRDMSPQNVIVGADGIARVLDFGVAKASARIQTTREGQLKGKVPYMAPEQLKGQCTRQSDIYAAGIVLWETLACQRLFAAPTEVEILDRVLHAGIVPPSDHNPDVPPELDRVVLRALSRDPAFRYATAREMAADMDEAMRPASSIQVAEWMEGTVGPVLAARSALVASIESGAGAPVLSLSSPIEVLSSASTVSHTLPTTPPPAVRSRTLLGAAIAGALALFVVAAIAFRVGASGSQPAPTSASAVVAVAPVETHPPARVAPAPSTPATSSDWQVVDAGLAVAPVATLAPVSRPTTPPVSTIRNAPLPSPHEGKVAPARGGHRAPSSAAPAAPAGKETPGDLNTLLDTH